MQTFEQKSVYHSHLVAASPLVVMITDAVKESKYRGKLPYVSFRVQGEPGHVEYQLLVENVACRSAIDAVPRSRWMTVTASGAREQAALSFVPAGGGADQHPDSPPSDRAAAVPGDGEPISRTYYRALRSAVEVVGYFKEQYDGREPSEAERQIAATLFIEFSRSGGRRPLSSGKRRPDAAKVAARLRDKAAEVDDLRKSKGRGEAGAAAAQAEHAITTAAGDMNLMARAWSDLEREAGELRTLPDAPTYDDFRAPPLGDPDDDDLPF